MGHGHPVSMAADPWIFGIALTVVIVVVLVIWLIHRSTVASDGLTPMERKNLTFSEREILSMVRQHGGPIRQTEIVDLLSDDLEDLAGIMKDMETKGLIHREWKPDQGTYVVSTRPESSGDRDGQ